MNPAEISEYLIPHPVIRKVSFTGSTVVGKHLAALAGKHMKRLSEIGVHLQFRQRGMQRTTVYAQHSRPEDIRHAYTDRPRARGKHARPVAILHEEVRHTGGP